ncbi:Zf-FLZ domain-containing protein [Dioscorea alata]|uniref:Zf-FLZ domain-containing protein n=1 Tax=Dioscorea alata TaxID=55571 RepID=A0ACB7W877_DIOAL|nr:Zf-FLZ domain-containing protein [Dioscorea alata]
MLTRNKSIFHLEEDDDINEEEQEEEEDDDDYKAMEEKKSFVGLQIVIQHQNQNSNIVTKHILKAPQVVQQSSSHSGFLNSCHLCKRKLSLQMDVYMYRGDQGYCTPECRSRQMIIDERRELEASSSEHIISFPLHHEVALEVKNSDPQSRVSAAA